MQLPIPTLNAQLPLSIRQQVNQLMTEEVPQFLMSTLRDPNFATRCLVDVTDETSQGLMLALNAEALTRRGPVHLAEETSQLPMSALKAVPKNMYCARYERLGLSVKRTGRDRAGRVGRDVAHLHRGYPAHVPEREIGIEGTSDDATG